MGFYDLPQKVEEGLCTLSEYLWLQRFNTQEAEIRRRIIAENRDPIYGEGFRQAAAALKKKELAEMLTYVRKHQKFLSMYQSLLRDLSKWRIQLMNLALPAVLA